MGHIMYDGLKELFFWSTYIIFRLTQFSYRWLTYNLFPEKHECGEYLKYLPNKYLWELNKDFKPFEEEDKYPYDFLVCEHCKEYTNIDEEYDG
jgi:hypothetical protein